MTPCPSCRRHVHSADSACPFCGSTIRTGAVRRVGGTLLAALTPVLLAACYGMQPKDCDTGGGGGPGCLENDNDGDGFAADVDCDDTDETINPDAVEVCDDGVDNDCDLAADGDDDDCAAG